MKAFKRIGTVEILRMRNYPLDPMNRDMLATEVVVNTGEYPLMSDGYTHLWMMTGRINGNFMRRGDGMFVGGGGDMPIDNLVVTFPSRIFGPDEWKELLDHPTCQEGHPEQRLRITVNNG
jgi:hypothetical protein